jgi:hypothetical protein
VSTNPYARHDDQALVRQLREAAGQRCHMITLDLADDIARRLRAASDVRTDLLMAQDRIRYLEQFVTDEIRNPAPAPPDDVYRPTRRNE